MSRFEVRRPDLDTALLARVREGPPALLTGPPGAGKTTLLLQAAAALSREGWVPVYLDLMGAASSPDRFVLSALDALPAEAFGRLLPQAVEIRRLATAGREHGAEAVRALLALWSSLEAASGRPVALLLDEATEIRSLAYFPALREVHKPFLAALRSRRKGTLLATSFPTLAGKLWPGLDGLAAPPLAADEVRPLLAGFGRAAEADALVLACAGWPRHVAVLVRRLVDGDDVVTAWAEEMERGGRLELGCRSTYEMLLLRSRGYGIAKAVLAAVAEEEGQNLTALVARVGRTPGATRDYLQWLVGVDALRMTQKRYFYVDGLVRWWVRLYGRGTLPTLAQLRAAAREAIALAAPGGFEEAPAGPTGPRRDSLIEID